MSLTSKTPLFKIIVNTLLSLLLLGAGYVAATKLMQSAPKAKQKSREPRALLVQTRTIAPQANRADIHTTGSVEAAWKTVLSSQVSGEIVTVNPDLVPGNCVHEGTLLITIDPTDFKAALLETQSSLIQAEADLRLEAGEQAVAREEYKLLGREMSPQQQALALREPYLKKAQAVVQTAEAAYVKAQKDLNRTQIRAPFDGIISSKSAAAGMRAAAGTELLTMIDTSVFWIRAEVDRDDLRLIRFADVKGRGGSQVQIVPLDYEGRETARRGRVLRLLPEVDTASRRATVLIALDDPLLLKAEAGERHLPIPVGELVDVTIAGRVIENSVKLPYNLLRSHATVWVMKEGRLKIVPVKILHRGRESVLVGGLKGGEAIVMTGIKAPVEGMLLKRLAPEPADRAQ